MFLHSFYYQWKKLYHQRVFFFWNLLFPILLSCMFYAGFSNLSGSEALSVIPVAVVTDKNVDTSSYTQAIDSVSQNDQSNTISNTDTTSQEEQLLSVTYTDGETARQMLEEKEVTGILTVSHTVKLTVLTGSGTEKLSQSILNSFTSALNSKVKEISNIATTHPEQLSAAMAQMSKTTSYTKAVSFANGDMSESLTYFFNLVAMLCLYGNMVGSKVAMEGQANLSQIARLKAATAVNKSVALIGELSASYLYQLCCILLTVAFMAGPLGVNFGTQIGYVILICVIGCFFGVSFGYFIGSLGRISENTKVGLMMAASMILCFLSGLMAGSIRMLVTKYFPVFNHINPAALISDSFYSLTVYQSHHRLFLNLIILAGISFVLCIMGFFMTRREKYASL